MAKLTEQKAQEIIRYLDAGKPQPDQHRCLLIDDKRDVEPLWSGKIGEVMDFFWKGTMPIVQVAV